MQPAKKRIINPAFSGPKLGKIIMPTKLSDWITAPRGKNQDAGPLEVRALFRISESGWNAAKTVLTSKNRVFSPLFSSRVTLSVVFRCINWSQKQQSHVIKIHPPFFFSFQGQRDGAAISRDEIRNWIWIASSFQNDSHLLVLFTALRSILCCLFGFFLQHFC